jgi:CheY-like chemotaxis protein
MGDGVLSCPNCSALISIAADLAPAASPPEAPPAPAPAEEVVCPRCMLHFTPGRVEIQPETPTKRDTVLVVEDLAYFREIAREALAEDYEVKTVETAAEARSALAAGGIDLLILDLSLDGGDQGVQLLRELTLGKPCPILIYTAQDESEMYGDSWERLHEMGADDIVIKGMNVGESLLRKVDTLLGRTDDEQDPVSNTVTSRE